MAEGRDEQGRFAAGTVHNPAGRPRGSKPWNAKLRAAARDQINAERTGNVMEAMYQAAAAGDVQAAKLYLKHSIGERPLYADADGAIELDADAIAGGHIGGAVAALVAAFAVGRIEAAELRVLIESMTRAAETIGFATRLDALETTPVDGDVLERADRLRAELRERQGGSDDAVEQRERDNS